AGLGDENVLAIAAQLGYPQGIAIDSAGTLYIADTNNNRVRKVDPATGVIRSLPQKLDQPTDITVDAANNLYVVDRSNLTKIAVNGEATTIGAAGTAVAIDGSRNVYVANASTGAVLKIHATTMNIETLATVNQPRGIAVDSDANVFIAETANN